MNLGGGHRKIFEDLEGQSGIETIKRIGSKNVWNSHIADENLKIFIQVVYSLLEKWISFKCLLSAQFTICKPFTHWETALKPTVFEVYFNGILQIVFGRGRCVTAQLWKPENPFFPSTMVSGTRLQSSSPVASVFAHRTVSTPHSRTFLCLLNPQRFFNTTKESGLFYITYEFHLLQFFSTFFKTLVIRLHFGFKIETVTYIWLLNKAWSGREKSHYIWFSIFAHEICVPRRDWLGV